MTTEIKKPGRILDYNKTLPILELYTCIQSEGSRQGRPTVAVRTTGCTHRCWFGAGGWCDSWYTSIHPGKGTYTFNDIIKIYDENPNITEMMLTGGSPTMQPDLCNELTHFANERGIFITIETEGSHFVETDYPIGLISLSPKFIEFSIAKNLEELTPYQKALLNANSNAKVLEQTDVVEITKAIASNQNLFTIDEGVKIRLKVIALSNAFLQVQVSE
jgi:7-carboxy-7-deazaguanine synthase